jgi:hypothetical protein
MVSAVYDATLGNVTNAKTAMFTKKTDVTFVAMDA